MGVSRVTRNYQVTIPKDVREVQDIKIGDKIVFAIEGDKIGMLKVKKDVAKKAFGLWKDEIKGPTLAYVRGMRKEWERRNKRLGV